MWSSKDHTISDNKGHVYTHGTEAILPRNNVAGSISGTCRGCGTRAPTLWHHMISWCHLQVLLELVASSSLCSVNMKRRSQVKNCPSYHCMHALQPQESTGACTHSQQLLGQCTWHFYAFSNCCPLFLWMLMRTGCINSEWPETLLSGDHPPHGTQGMGPDCHTVSMPLSSMAFLEKKWEASGMKSHPIWRDTSCLLWSECYGEQLKLIKLLRIKRSNSSPL